MPRLTKISSRKRGCETKNLKLTEMKTQWAHQSLVTNHNRHRWNYGQRQRPNCSQLESLTLTHLLWFPVTGLSNHKPTLNSTNWQWCLIKTKALDLIRSGCVSKNGIVGRSLIFDEKKTFLVRQAVTLGRKEVPLKLKQTVSVCVWFGELVLI